MSNEIATQSEAITQNDLKAVMNSMLNIFYPIGSYYETSDTTFNPNTAWGGTWELEASGQVHVSAGTGYSISGALTNTSDGGSPYIQAHSHGFTNPIIPDHVHPMGGHTHASTSGYYMLFLSTSGNNAVNRRSIKPGTSTALTNNYYGANAIERGSVTGGMSSSVNTGNPTTKPSCTGGAVGAVSGATTGNANNMQPYIVVNRWHRIYPSFIILDSDDEDPFTYYFVDGMTWGDFINSSYNTGNTHHTPSFEQKENSEYIWYYDGYYRETLWHGGAVKVSDIIIPGITYKASYTS